MRTAYVYVKVDLDNSGDSELASYVVSTVPFVWHYGDILIPAKSEQRPAGTYTELCSILKKDFQIPESLLPPAEYFRPTQAEELAGYSDVYRVVPEGTGEPEWRMDARQAIVAILEDDATTFERGRVVLNGRVCYSMDELRLELETIAEQAVRSHRSTSNAYNAYQPDCKALVTEILSRYSGVLAHSELRQRVRKR